MFPHRRLETAFLVLNIMHSVLELADQKEFVRSFDNCERPEALGEVAANVG